jgi:hypothetical protein
MRVIHIIPDSVVNLQYLFLGSTKDIRGRTEYFKERGIPFDEIVVKARSDRWLLKRLQGMDLSQYTRIFFEYPIYPASLRFLRKHFPQLKLLTRSHQGEFYHRLHYALAHVLYGRNFKILRDFENSLIRLGLDWLCARRSDYILSITQWEVDNYWRYLIDTSKIVAVPYFLPSLYKQFILPIKEKKFQCVCLTSVAQTTSILIDAAKRFVKLVEGLGQRCSEWNFFITGDFSSNILNLSKRVTLTNLLDNPFKILAESRAITIFSNFGFGFKTKILDAIHNKCYILVPRMLYQRLPVEVRPYCIVVNMNSVESFKDSLRKCLEPYPDGNPNEILRKQAFAALDKVIF